jgi:hypothetical protein
MEDLSIFYSLLQFLSMVYSFHCIGLSLPLLSLFLGILFFEAIVNGIVFLYSFSVCSLLMYKKATDFCKLILYPASLLRLFMVSRRFFLEGGVLGIRSCHLQIGIV